MATTERYITWLLTVIALLLTGSATTQARLTDRYDSEHPLVIYCDWELPPYEFLDDNGTPTGYTIDLLTIIMERLQLPYNFILKENPVVNADSATSKTGLFIISNQQPRPKGLAVGTNVLSYYKLMLVSRANEPPVTSLSDIEPGKMVIIRLDGRISVPLMKKSKMHASVEYHAPMEALSGVSSGKYDYFVWGEEPLKWKIKELNLDNLRLNDVGITPAELRVASFDHELVTSIDDTYARLEQSGELTLLRDKWFHPERHHDNASPVALYVAIAAVLMLIVLVLIHRLVSKRVAKMTQQNSEQTRLMNMALDMGGYMVTEYNPRRDSFNNQRGRLMADHDTLASAQTALHPDDRQAFMDKVNELKGQGITTSDLLVRRNNGTNANPQWHYLTGNCIKEHNEDTHHTTYLLVAKDITAEMEKQHTNDIMAAKYRKAFDISLVAMSFYDPSGQLLDINERMKQIINENEETIDYFYTTNLFEAPLFVGVLMPGMTEVVHACQHMYYPEMGLDKFLEYRVRPVFNEANEVRYYAVTVRDITAERQLYLQQTAIERQLKVTNDENSKFEDQLHYLLSNSNMFLWRSYYKTGMVEVSRSLRQVDFTFSFKDYLDSVADEDEKESVRTTFYNPLMRGHSINFIRHYSHSVLTDGEAWFAVSGTPVFDKDGLSVGHFGVIRNVTQLMRSREELRRETAQAQQSGQLKATFLANMTHEIRTPLNAIVGFSDVLHMTTDPNERQEFLRIIRHNCDLLLRLIDDILETSNMNERPQSIEPVDTDFATFFNEVSQTVAQRVTAPGVSFIKDNPFDTFTVCTDKERVQQVITNFVTNAVKYTNEGHIKVGYRQEERNGRDGIYIYCEDTGAGIPKEKQASVFDRFVKLNDYVQGTGLGLSICKAIADRCQGQIGVMSEGEGKGCTFWLWIPRYLTSSNL